VKEARHLEVVQRRGKSILTRQRLVHPRLDGGHYLGQNEGMQRGESKEFSSAEDLPAVVNEVYIRVFSKEVAHLLLLL
jgi:hypothetical protein